jgi:beta-galactosidase
MIRIHADKKFCLILRGAATLFLLMCTLFVFAQYPPERKQLFDHDWKFYLGNDISASSKNFNDENWRRLDLPHDWSIEGKVNPKNPTGGGGGYFPAGIGWYRKTFDAPAEWKGRKVSIYFEGVYMNSEVFVNGKSLGVYPYGYSSFMYDLSPYLEFGRQNVVAVKVDNSQHINSRWYSGSGIYRHVWMLVTDPLHVANWGVAITTPNVSAKNATVQIRTRIQNETSSSQVVFVNVQIQNKDLKSVGNAQIKVQLAAYGEKEVTQILNVSNPLLWTPEGPNLYTAHVQLVKRGVVVDDVQHSFGIRSIDFTAEKGFLLNGKMVKMNGGCVHHDNGCLGAAAFDRAEERKVELLKSAGFNAVRTSHNPPSEAFLEACDRLGLLVMDESFDCWKIGKNKEDYGKYFSEWWKRDLEAMVLRDRNHPSIIMWSIGNEIPERGSPEAVETATMLVNAVKKMDTSRPVTSAIVMNDKEWTAFDPLMAAHDVAGYNYHLHSAPEDHKRVPSRMIVHTESYPKDAFANWKLVQNNNYVIGDFVWTAMDYLGESGIGRWYYSGEAPGEHWEGELFPWHGAYCGDIDLTGWRKPISHYRSLLYNKTEKLYLAVREPNPEPLEIKQTWWSVWPMWESWTWPGHEGKNIEIEIYSKYSKVRLYLNSKLIGEKETTERHEHKATFTIPYAAGELKAVAVDEQKEMESTLLNTSYEPASIKLNADRKELLANGQDLCFVTVEIVDKNGVIQPNAVNPLKFKVDGPGVVAGVHNADVKDSDPYVSDTRKAWHGRALLVIRTTRDTGKIKLMVSSPGLAEATMDIDSVEKTEAP